MKILYCNLSMTGRSGTEIVTIDTVLGLHRRGVNVCVYAAILGDSQRALADHGILVTSDLDQIPWRPDLVHANHLAESLEAAARFPDTPQVHLCHDADVWWSAPPKLSLVRRWMAVDEVCAERLRADAPAFVADVAWMPNAVDLTTHQIAIRCPRHRDGHSC